MVPKRLCSIRIFLVAGIALAGLIGCDSKEERETDYLERGKALYAEGNLVKASLQFRNALQIDPKAVEGQYYLGLIAEKMGDYSAAYATFTRVVEQDPKNVQAQLKIAQYALLQDDRNQVLEITARIFALANNSAEAHALRAVVLQRQGKIEEAEQEATTALSADSKNMTSVSVLSGIKVNRGDVAGALKLLDNGILQNPKEDGLRLIKLKILVDQNDFLGSEAILRELIANSPANNSYKVSLAQLLLSQNRQGDAEKIFRDAIINNPDDRDLKLLLVQFIVQQHGMDAGETELLAFTKAAPDDFAYLQALFELYIQNGKADKAKAILADIITKDQNHPNTLAAKADLARLALSDGDQAQVNVLIGEILADDPQNQDALLMRAESALKTGDTQAAIPDLRTILRATPNAKQALLMLINAYADSGEDQLAIRTYRDYLNVDPENDLIRVEFAQRLMNAKKFDEADKQITQILQRSPKFVPALLTRINQRIIQKNWLEAVEVANRIIQDAGDEMEGRAALGKIYLAQGQAKKAIGELQRVNAAKPGPSEARSMLIQALIQDHQSVQAIGLLTKSTAADPKDADAFDLLGDVYFTLNRPDEALEALKQCIKARPKWDLPYLKLISLDMKMGQQTEAAELARAALKEMPNHPQLLLNLAMIEDARDQFDAAREAYEAVLKQQPRNLIAANNLAALIADAWPKDKVRLEQARRLAEPFRNSNDPVLLDTLGWVQYRLGNIDDAIEILERSAKAKPELAEIRYHLGMAYKAHGDQARARLELELATTSAPMYRGLQDAKLTLDNL